jgi:hypothetical protein
VRRVFLSLLALLLVAVAASSAVPASAAGGVFVDVKAGTPFAADIEWLAAEEIAQGGADGRFRPKADVTRQAMAVFLYKFANRGTTAARCTAPAFDDVPKSSPYCGSITWLGQAGITRGTAGGGFRPLGPVTRQAMASFLYHLQYEGAAPPPCTKDAYDDVPASSSYCGAIRWLSRQRITTGDPAGNFDPTGTVTRGMMAAFLHRFELLRTAPVGADVSYPQCGKSLPVGQAFGIVGVNGGKPTTFNGCFADQLDWAHDSLGGTSQPKAQLYVNTANPGSGSAYWPGGTCAGQDTEPCAYLYGKARATEDLAKVTGAGDYVWWLDVETGNSWASGTAGQARNVAVLEGMTDTFLAAGVKVGLYSTGYQWGKIVGTAPLTGSPLLGLPSWLAGAASLGDAISRCGTHAPLTDGGSVAMVQYVEGGFDRNWACA